MSLNRHSRRKKAAIARKQKEQHRAKIVAHAKPPAQTKNITFTAPVRIAAVDAADPNRQRTFSIDLYTGEPMRIYPWDLPVVIDLDTVDLSAQTIPALYDHVTFDPDFIVGQVNRLSVQSGILKANGFFVQTKAPPERNYTQKIIDKADGGYQWQASVGGDPATVDKVEAGKSVLVNSRTYTGPLYVARGLIPREGSFVILGGDRKTRAVIASNSSKHPAAIKGQAMNFEQWCMGFMSAEEYSGLDESAKGALQKAYDASGVGDGATTAAADDDPPADPPADDDPPPAAAAARTPAITATTEAQRIAARRKADADEDERTNGIRRICAASPGMLVPHKGKQVPIQATAIREGWTVEKTELEYMRAERGAGPAAIINSTEKHKPIQAMQGAMMLRAGCKLDNPAYKTRQGQAMLGKLAPWLMLDINASDRNRYMEAAHKYSRMSIMEICAEACRLNMIDTGGMEREEMIKAAFSGGGNLTNIFTTNVNALLLSTYMEFGDDTTTGWVKEQDVNDFKTNERPRVNVGNGLKKLPRGGEAEHTSYTDSVESYKIARYAQQFEIDEQDAIDDNFGVFADVPAEMGRAAGRLCPDLVYGAVILANPTLSATSLALFSNSNSPDNLRGSSTMSHSTISANLAAMRLGRENSVNLNLQATHLIVPPTLEDLAIELTQSMNIIAGGDTGVTIRGETNSLQKRGLLVVAEPRLENGVVNPADETTQSGSSTTWYLACADAHTIEVGYLKGTGRAPRVRATVLDKGRWGMNWDVELSIGVKALDFKGLYQCTT